MELAYIRQRITDLRIKGGFSECQMSLDLGHSQSYIHNIVSGRSKPSVTELLSICNYLGVSPCNFFDEDNSEPALLQKLMEEAKGLSDKDILSLLSIIERIKDNSVRK